MPAPIVLFTYNRLWHAQQTIEALQQNNLARESDLVIFSDGAKADHDQEQVDETRRYLETVSGFKKVILIKREKNRGLAENIIDGVTRVVNEYGKVIILEDDIIVHPHFLVFMNHSLEKYRKEPQVHSITGFSHLQDNVMSEPYFLHLTSSWSWATWEDRWSTYKRDETRLKQFLSTGENRKKFDFNGSFPYSEIAQSYFSGKVQTWALFYHFDMLLKEGLVLYPHVRLVSNIGFDGSGTNCEKIAIGNDPFSYSPLVYPDRVEKSEKATILHENLFKKARQ